MTAEDMSGTAVFAMGEEGSIIPQDIRIKVKVEDLVSEYELMDENAYEALRYEDYPNISFRMRSVKEVKVSPQGYKVYCTGRFSIAGISKFIPLSATCQKDANGNILCKGTLNLKMSDFGIDPPEILLGTVQTHDPITVSFETTFLRK